MPVALHQLASPSPVHELAQARQAVWQTQFVAASSQLSPKGNSLMYLPPQFPNLRSGSWPLLVLLTSFPPRHYQYSSPHTQQPPANPPPSPHQEALRPCP